VVVTEVVLATTAILATAIRKILAAAIRMVQAIMAVAATMIEVDPTMETQVDVMIDKEVTANMDLLAKIAGDLAALVVAPMAQVEEATKEAMRGKSNRDMHQVIEVKPGATMEEVMTGKWVGLAAPETMEGGTIRETMEGIGLIIKVAEGDFVVTVVEAAVVTVVEEAAVAAVAEAAEEGDPTFRVFPRASRTLFSPKSRKDSSSFCTLWTAKNPMASRWKVVSDARFFSILDSGTIF
jgi:hypothetical protein